jgi:hypothetical protein
MREMFFMDVAHKARTPPRRGPEAAQERNLARMATSLYGSCAPGRRSSTTQSSAIFAAEDADEAAHRMLLPAGRFHDLGQGHALGALYHRDHVRFLGQELAPPLGRIFAEHSQPLEYSA